MIPDTTPCRCGAPVRLKGGRQWTREWLCGIGWRERFFWWAGGQCVACGFVLQYAAGGCGGDYQHARWWYLGNGCESWPGRPRPWPAAWGLEDEVVGGDRMTPGCYDPGPALHTAT